MTDLLVVETGERVVLITEKDDRGVLIVPRGAEPSLVVDERRETVLVPPTVPPTLVTIGDRGPPGPPGLPGAALIPTESAFAGEDLGGHRAVYVDTDGLLYYASSADDDTAWVLGITTGAVVTGAPATVRSFGSLSEPSWSWVPGLPIYLSTNGLLTQVAPTSGILVELGVATAADKVVVRIQEPVFLN